MSRPVVKVKLCGGCQQRYDRVSAWKEIQEACPFVEFVSAQQEVMCDLILVLGGCPVQCPDVKRPSDTTPVLRVCSPEQIPFVIQEMRRFTGTAASSAPPGGSMLPDPNKE